MTFCLQRKEKEPLEFKGLRPPACVRVSPEQETADGALGGGDLGGTGGKQRGPKEGTE